MTFEQTLAAVSAKNHLILKCENIRISATNLQKLLKLFYDQGKSEGEQGIVGYDFVSELLRVTRK